ncbi:protein kinase domain-containing protein [Aquirufa nivalisilvae]
MYPSELQYKHSVENKMYPPGNGINRFLPAMNDNNEVIFSSGGRAVVFKVIEEFTGKATALKFFTVEDQNRFQHYLEISNYLKNIKSNFLVNFQIFENLIYVEFDTENPYNNYFPGLVMDWASGVTLQSRLKELCEKGEKNNISKLKENFKKLAFFLLSENIAHGDLKHDNIIVNDDLDLVLVDYDGFFIPTFKGSQSSELGTSSFQHPQRKITDFNQRIDDFSILTIYTSLVAFENNPALFNKFYDEQNLLFSLEDFLKPEKSELFKTLSNQNETKALAFYIKQSLARESIYIENLKDLLNGKFPKPSIKISHSPTIPLIGQKVILSWKSSDVDFVKINGKDHDISGSKEELVKQDHSLDFEYGNAIDTRKESYKIKSAPQPEIVKFSANTYEVKFDEKIVLNWEARNFKEAILIYNKEEVNVKNLNTLTIDYLEKDTIFYLKLISEIDNYQVVKELKVEVYYPVKLEVSQDKKITFPNRPINIYLKSVNAQKVTLKPHNIDLTGKSSYEIITDKDFIGQISAENKRYSSPTQRIQIEVLKVPQRPQIIAKLPAIEFKISTPQFIRINNPEIRNGQNILNQIRTALEFLNIFKISTNFKRLHESRRK